ncbi:hypothetical protein SKZB199_0246 [Streptococcus sp. ZB199]|nr:hypothetical protein SKZB199_0246 [Streptococcus sp. ZB199]
MLGNQGFVVFSGRGIFANKLQYKLTDFVIILVYTIKSRSQVYIVARENFPHTCLLTIKLDRNIAVSKMRV